MEEEEKCKGDHKINGVVPLPLDIQYDGVICDCQRIKFYTQMCGCSEPHLELLKKPNE